MTQSTKETFGNLDILRTATPLKHTKNKTIIYLINNDFKPSYSILLLLFIK